MIRSLATAAVLAALVAAVAAYAVSQQATWNAIEAWIGWPRRTPQTVLATENWPICSTMAAMGSETDWAGLDPDFAAGKKALVAEDWKGAITALKLAALRDTGNADIQNYIGYA